ncbi:hypothetical protein Tco_1221246 [Tanacetum coccineum]
MDSFIKWYCKQIRKSKLTKADLEGPTFKLVKPFHKNNISLQFKMERCHLLLTNKIDLTNPDGNRVVPNISKLLPLGGPSTRIRILDKLDHMVKDFRLFKYNPGMENRIWSEDDKRRSKEFMEVIERRLKIRRIFRSLESFVSGRVILPKKQFAKTQHAEETVTIANATQSLEASDSAEEQVNQPKTAEAEKLMDEIDQKNKVAQEQPESPYDTESEIKIIKRFQPRQPDDDAQITFLGTVETFNAFDDMLAQSDPLGHLHEELRTLHTKVDQLESSISKKVIDDIQSSMPSIVADTLKANFPCILLKTLKNTLP